MAWERSPSLLYWWGFGGTVVDDNLTLGIQGRWELGVMGKGGRAGEKTEIGEQAKRCLHSQYPVTSQGSSSNIFFNFQNLKTY